MEEIYNNYTGYKKPGSAMEMNTAQTLKLNTQDGRDKLISQIVLNHSA